MTSTVPVGPINIYRSDLPNPIDPSDPRTPTLADVAPVDIQLVGHDAAIDVSDRILNVALKRTIDGASTVTVTLSDPDLTVLNSTAIKGNGDGNLYALAIIDKLVFQLVKIETAPRRTILTLESEAIHRLRGFKGPKSLSRGTITRALFFEVLCSEAGVQLVCPELNDRQRIQTVQEAQTPAQRDKQRAPGFRTGVKVMVGGKPLGPAQLENASVALSAAHDLKADFRSTLALAEACIVEPGGFHGSGPFDNPTGGDASSVGILQLLNIHLGGSTSIHGGRRDIALVCKLFLTKGFSGKGGALALAKQHPDWSPGQIAQGVQGSAYPDRYETHRQDAANIVAAFNGGNLDGELDTPETYAVPYQFKRLKGEDSWTCMRRLADEVGWHVFECAGTVYFMSPSQLKKSRPRMLAAPGADGIDEINVSYDTSPKADNQIQVICHAARWAAPPGSVVEVQGLGPLDVDARWLVSEIARVSLASTRTTITLSKFRRKVLLEPAHDVATRAPTTATPTSSTTITPQVPGSSGTRSGGKVNGTYPGSPVPGIRAHAPDHPTGGLPGYPAYDYLAPAGTACVAPVDGKIRRFSGHDPKLGAVQGAGGPLGWSIYLAGDNGKDYFLTHLGSRSVQVGDRVVQGQKIGTIANYHSFGRPDHIHMGVRA